MSDEANTNTAVNNEVSAASANVEGQNQAVNTPLAESAGSVGNSEPGPIPYSRFKEKVDQYNQLESRLEEITNRLTAQESNVAQKQRTNAAEKYEKQLVERGVDAQVAKVLAEASFGLVNDVIGERVSPLEQEAAGVRVEQWVNKLAQTHKDFYELEPDMNKILDAMPKHMQSAFMSSPEGIDALYSKAKLKKMQESQQKVFDQGANAAYQNKGLKGAVASAPGASVPKPQGLSREEILKLSDSDFRARYQEILAARSQEK